MSAQIFETEEGAQNFCKKNPGYVARKRRGGSNPGWIAGVPSVIPPAGARKVISPNRVKSAAEFFADIGPRRWYVKKVLPHGRALIVVYGAPGEGKSFFVVDLLTCVHRGVSWNGLQVEKARVLFLVAEGAHDAKYRGLAMAKHLGCEPSELPGYIENNPNLLDAAAVTDVITQIKSAGGCDILAIDTLAQTMAGNENDPRDMGGYVRALQRISTECNCQILAIHHSGKDRSKGSRGWSGLLAAVDGEMCVSATGDKHAAEITKMKGSVKGARYGFTLKVVPLGVDKDGEQYDSCVPIYCDAAERAASTRDLGKVCLDVAREFVSEGKGKAKTKEIVDEVRSRVESESGKKPTSSNANKSLRVAIRSTDLRIDGSHVVRIEPIDTSVSDPFAI